MISHRNVIANVLQFKVLEQIDRDARPGNGSEVCLGLLPLSHIYGLVVVAQGSTYRGDEVIIMPKFELDSFLKAISKYKIEMLYLVRTTCLRSLLNGTNYRSGSSNHHPIGQESSGMLQVRPEQRQRLIHRRSTIGSGDSRRTSEDLSKVADSSRLWSH